MLRGPADADQFRIKVGRYGDRWYHDPLPACDLAPAWDESVPSTSIVKNAWPKFLTKWAAGEAARCAVDDRDIWSRMQPDAARTYISGASDRVRDRAADRGSAVHSILEAFSFGRQPNVMDVAQAADYVPVCEQLIADLQPEWIFAEAVMISRRHGVGGTGDGGWRIDGANYIVDFKSRGVDENGVGKHGAYDDEAAQLGSYAVADYMIIDEGGQAVRRQLPEFDGGGLVISIAPDGYRLYPVDLDKAKSLFVALRGFWGSMQANKPVGKPVILKSAAATAPLAAGPSTSERAAGPCGPAPTSAPSHSWLVDRAKAIIGAGHGITLAARWPDHIPTLKIGGHTDDQLVAIAELLSAVERDHGLPFPEPELMQSALQAAAAHASALLKPVIKLGAVIVETPEVVADRTVPPSHSSIVDIIERGKRLPADLVEKLTDLTVNQHGIPNLLSGKATVSQVALAKQALATVNSEHGARMEDVAKMLDVFAPDEAVVFMLEATDGRCKTPAEFTGADVDRLTMLLAAVGRLVIAFTYDGAQPVLMTTEHAERLIVERYGSKSTALAAAQTSAARFDMKKPRSVAQAAANPLLAASLTFDAT